MASPDGALTPNLDAFAFVQQDKLLVTWLLSMISASLLSCFTAAKMTCNVWTILNRLFTASTGAKVSCVWHELHSVTNGLSSEFDVVLTLASFSSEALPF
ncbi:hypothetical protein V6Z12_D11G301700 [Gossypium hirsutum]